MNFSSVDTSSSDRSKAFQTPLPPLDHLSACRRAVTSISIRIRGSANPAEIIMAAGRTFAEVLPQDWPALREVFCLWENVRDPNHIPEARPGLLKGRLDIPQALLGLLDQAV